MIENICSALFERSGDLEKEFSAFDLDGDGRIDYSEFLIAMRKLNLGLSDSQIYDLMRSIDKVYLNFSCTVRSIVRTETT